MVINSYDCHVASKETLTTKYNQYIKRDSKFDRIAMVSTQGFRSFFCNVLNAKVNLLALVMVKRRQNSMKKYY